jgi:SAM-dependent methyltransferase
MDGNPAAVMATLNQLSGGIGQLPVELDGARVIELGSGRTPEVALSLAAAGAASVHGVDVTLQIPPGWHERISAVRDLAAETLGRRRRGPLDDGEVVRRVRFSRYDGEHLPASDASVDLIVSKSVMEHVSPTAVLPLLRDMRRVLHAAGGVVHVIDLRDHMFINGDEVSGDWLDALRYPEPLFRAMFSNRSTAINRLRASEWRELFASAGLSVVDVEQHRYPLPREFDRGRLAGRWRELADEELMIGQIVLVASPAPR